MRIAVVTAYYDEPLNWVRQCHESVLAQSIPATHFLVGDGPDAPDLLFPQARCSKLPRRTGDFGDSPRAEGWRLAAEAGFDAIAFLDADNWYEPDHLLSLHYLRARTGANVCTSRRKLHRVDGSLLGYCLNSNGETFCDTNCFLFTKRAFHWRSLLLSMPDWARAIGDRVLWHALRSSGEQTAHTGQHTVAYRTKFAGHYTAFGEAPPAELKTGSNAVEIALERWEQEGHPSLHFDVSVSEHPCPLRPREFPARSCPAKGDIHQ